LFVSGYISQEPVKGLWLTNFAYTLIIRKVLFAAHFTPLINWPSRSMKFGRKSGKSKKARRTGMSLYELRSIVPCVVQGWIAASC
jgi:hypothetical protein